MKLNAGWSGQDGESEESDGRLSVLLVVGARRTAVQRVVDGRRRTDEVDRQLGQRSVGDVEVAVEQHGRRGARHAVAVLRQRDARRALDEHAAAHARRTPGPRRHLHRQ